VSYSPTNNNDSARGTITIRLPSGNVNFTANKEEFYLNGVRNTGTLPDFFSIISNSVFNASASGGGTSGTSAIGSITDSAKTSPTDVGTLIAFLKGLHQRSNEDFTDRNKDFVMCQDLNTGQIYYVRAKFDVTNPPAQFSYLNPTTGDPTSPPANNGTVIPVQKIYENPNPLQTVSVEPTATGLFRQTLAAGNIEVLEATIINRTASIKNVRFYKIATAPTNPTTGLGLLAEEVVIPATVGNTTVNTTNLKNLLTGLSAIVSGAAGKTDASSIPTQSVTITIKYKQK
jgi:hypothetical protein